MIVIAGLQRVSLIDYPDRIAASIFLAGCNLDCAYCHNRWMIREAEVTPALSVGDLLSWLGTRVRLLDGVCISGGEPTLQPDLGDLLQPIKALGLAVKLDTNGLFPQQLDRLLDRGLLDYVAMDIKAPLDARYAEVAGRPVRLGALSSSMGLLREHAPAYEFRTTVGPQIDEQALIDIASALDVTDPWFLQVYQEAPGIGDAMRGQPALGGEDLRRIAERLRQWAPNVQVRGI